MYMPWIIYSENNMLIFNSIVEDELMNESTIFSFHV